MDCLVENGRKAHGPVWIALHGSGRDTADMPPLVRAFAPGDALVVPRGPFVWEQGHAFFRRGANGAPDEAEVGTTAAALEAYLTNLIKQRYQGREIWLYGCSNGAVMGAALLLRGVLRPSGAVLLRPMPPFRNPPGRPSLETQVLLLEARSDPRRDPGDAAALAGQLRRRGAQVSLRTTNGGHPPGEEDHRITAFWRQERA